VRLLTCSTTSGAFRRMRIVAPPISPSGIFASQTAASWYAAQEPAFSRYPSVSGRADRRRRRYTIRTSDRRIVWRALAEEFQDSLVKRAASSHFLPRSVQRILASFSFSFSGMPRRREAMTLVSSRGDHLLLTDSANDRFAVHAAEGRPNVLAADLSRISKDDARANRRTVFENNRNLATGIARCASWLISLSLNNS